MKDFPSFLGEEIAKGTRNADGRGSTFNKSVSTSFRNTHLISGDCCHLQSSAAAAALESVATSAKDAETSTQTLARTTLEVTSSRWSTGPP